MARARRTRRVLKWVGLSLCFLLVVVWAVSAWFHVWVNGPNGSWRYRVAIVSGALLVWDAQDDIQHASRESMALASYRAAYDQYPGGALQREREVPLTREQLKRNIVETEASIDAVTSTVCWRRVHRDSFAEYARTMIWVPRFGRFPRRTNGQLDLPLWLAFMLVAVPTGWLWWRDRRRAPPGYCQACGYNLTANVSGVCPKCGTTIEAEGKSA